MAIPAEAPLVSSDRPLALARFPKAELRDVDCERVHSSIVDWPSLRDQVQLADDEWKAAFTPSCMHVL